MFKKTKNFVKHKKTYLKDSFGKRYAPFHVRVEDYDDYIADAIRALAWRNSGHETRGRGLVAWGTLEFDFFTKKGLSTFIKKVESRYENAYVYVWEAKSDVSYRPIRP